jgi:hypothetical protein
MDRVVALAFTAVYVLLAWGCRWIAFHHKEFVFKCFPFYDPYYQPSKLTLASSKFFGLAGHVLFTLGTVRNLISVCLPARFADLAMFPALIIAVFVCKRTLRGMKLSAQKEQQA